MATDDIKKLIAVARTPVYASTSDEVWGRGGVAPVDRDDLIRALADALEAEHQRAERLFARAEGERDALRGAIQGVLDARDMEWDLPPSAHVRLSRAIDTKEKP